MSRKSPPEAALMLPVLHTALRIGWASQMSKADVEVRWHQKRLDLCLLSGEGLIVVELKVGDWRRALDQAFVNRWIAHSSWVALWHEKATSTAYDAALEAGVGLLVVTRRTAYPWLMPAAPIRPDDESPVSEALSSGRTRIRDLLGAAHQVHSDVRRGPPKKSHLELAKGSIR